MQSAHRVLRIYLLCRRSCDAELVLFQDGLAATMPWFPRALWVQVLPLSNIPSQLRQTGEPICQQGSAKALGDEE